MVIRSNSQMVSLRTAVTMTLVAVAVFFAGVYAASARDGVAGGASRSYLTVAGTVRGVTGTPTLTFRFRRAGTGTMALCEPRVTTTVQEGGAFSVQVPLEDPASPCPADLFNGSDVVVDVRVGDITVVVGGAVNPVPYAVRADVAATAQTAEAASGALRDRLSVVGPRGDFAPPADGWHQVGPDRYIYSRYVRSPAAVPRCTGGNTDVDIAVPPNMDTSRDKFWSGHIAVLAQYSGVDSWQPAVWQEATFHGETPGNRVPRMASAITAPPTFSFVRGDNSSPSFIVRIPCMMDFVAVGIHIDTYIRHVD